MYIEYANCTREPVRLNARRRKRESILLQSALRIGETKTINQTAVSYATTFTGQTNFKSILTPYNQNLIIDNDRNYFLRVV